MKRFTFWLAGFFVREDGVADNIRRAGYGIFCGWVSIIMNLLLTVVKIVLGMITGSISLLADAFHTASDAASSVVIVVGFAISRRPADAEHPYGHGRAEYIVGLILSVLLFVVAIEFFRSSIERLFNPDKITASYLTVAIVASTILAKELLSRFTDVIATHIDSDALRADSWHHRSDAVTSVFVIAAIIGARFGLLWIDGIMGIIVAGIIALVAVKILKNASNRLLGSRPSEETIRKIYNISRSIDGVLSVHDVSVHSYGATKMISLHAQVPENIQPMEAHGIAEKIEKTLNSALHPASTIVHIDPVDVKSRMVKKIIDKIREFRESHPDLVAFHDVRIITEDDKKIIDLDIAMRKGSSDTDIETMKNNLSEYLLRNFEGHSIRIDVDPDYFYQRPAKEEAPESRRL